MPAAPDMDQDQADGWGDLDDDLGGISMEDEAEVGRTTLCQLNPKP